MYDKGWEVETVAELQRIKNKHRHFKKDDFKTLMARVSTKIRLAADHGADYIISHLHN